MKNLLLLLFGIATFAFTSCKKTQVNEDQQDRIGLPTDIIPQYNITLEGISNLNNQTRVTWKIMNPNPNTIPDLKFWSLVLSDATIGNNIVAAYYGSSEKTLIPAPANYHPVPGSCYLGSALNFNYGTNGSMPSFYVVVFKGNYREGISYAVTESDAKNDCMKGKIPGIGDQ